jgi:hypothetical protein
MIVVGFVMGIKMYGLHSYLHGAQNICLKAIANHQRILGIHPGMI